MDRRAWRATVHGVTNSQTRVSDFHFHWPPLQFSNTRLRRTGNQYNLSWMAASGRGKWLWYVYQRPDFWKRINRVFFFFFPFFLFNCKQQMTSLAILYKNEIIGNARQEYRIHRRPEDKIWKTVRKRRALEVWAAESWLSWLTRAPSLLFKVIPYKQHIVLLCPWTFSVKNTGVSCPFLLQGIILIHGANPLLHFLHWQVNSLPLCHLGSPFICRGPYL